MSLLDDLAPVLGPRGLATTPREMARWLEDPITRRTGTALAVLRPATPAAAAEGVRLCHAAGVPMVPRGGGTGFVAGAVTDDPQAVVISLDRMTRLRGLEPEEATVAVDAGMTLAELNRAAGEVGLMLPIRHGGQGSAQIGGTLATNAGGYNVLRHGMARAHVLGLEVVLPDGTLWDGLRTLRKDNTGIDLKQLFLGAEGTLGLITGAVLQLQPVPTQRATALLAVPGPAEALSAFLRLRARLGEVMAACELFPAPAVQLWLDGDAARRAPFAPLPPWMLLVELETALPGFDASAALEGVLAGLLDGGLCTDGLVAQSEAQRAAIWACREGLATAQAESPRVLKSDTAVPLSRIPAFIAAASRAVDSACAGAVPLPFGHLGDGNIHFNVMAPAELPTEEFRDRIPALTEAVLDTSLAMGGTISAEHGIGRVKRNALAAARDPAELALMRRVKQALDPAGLMNPGAVV